MATLPKDENCADLGDHLAQQGVRDYGTVGYPLRGWVGCDGQQPLQGVTVESYSRDGKFLLASTTTNKSGKFQFRELKEGTYILVVTAKGLSREEAVVRSSRKSETVPCVFAVPIEE